MQYRTQQKEEISMNKLTKKQLVAWEIARLKSILSSILGTDQSVADISAPANALRETISTLELTLKEAN